MNSRSKKKKTNSSQITHQQDQACEENGNNRDRYIPIPIVSKILKDVPMKTLISCLLVCKPWADLILTPEFAKLHLSRSPTMFLMKPIYKERKNKRLHLVDPESPSSRENKLVFFPKINIPNVQLTLVNSCNGLVCLGKLIDGGAYIDACNIFVCNPVLGEYVTLPKPPFYSTRLRISSCSFVFDHITDKYKVVLSAGVYGIPSKIYLYTLGESSWKVITDVRFLLENICDNACVHGSIHWTGKGSGCVIRCLDFVSEEIRVLLTPSEMDKPDFYPSYKEQQLGVIHDNLSLCHSNYKVNRITIWVMKEYGVRESWNRDYVITENVINNFQNRNEPILVNASGDIFIIFENRSIMRFDSNSQLLSCERDICGVRSKFHAVGHVPSLVSLKEFVTGDNLEAR